MNITHNELFAVLTPLLLALHEKGVLDISETALLYEDVLARRSLENQEADDSVQLLQVMAQGLYRLAGVVKNQQSGERHPPPA